MLLLVPPPQPKMPYGRGARQARSMRTQDSSEGEASPPLPRAPAAISKSPCLGGGSSSSDGGALSSLQAQELVHAVEEARKSGNTDLVVHGWTVRCKRRSNKPRCDIEVRDPLEGVTLYSIVSLKRHLGLEPDAERVVKRPKSSADGSGSTPPPTPVWVACDACDKWRELSSTGGPLPATWYCSMHPDPALASCDVPEASYQEDGGMWEYDEAAMLEAAAEEAVAEVEAEAAAETAAAVAAAEEEAMGAMIDSAGAVADSAPVDEWLLSVRDALQIREPLSHIAAANDLLSSPQVGGNYSGGLAASMHAYAHPRVPSHA